MLDISVRSKTYGTHTTSVITSWVDEIVLLDS